MLSIPDQNWEIYADTQRLSLNVYGIYHKSLVVEIVTQVTYTYIRSYLGKSHKQWYDG